MATMKVITATLAAALLLTACGSSDDSGTPSAAPAPTASSATPSATPTPAPTPTPKPAPRATPPPKAKDGTNLAACRDADCQVQVSGRTTIKFSGGKLVITKIDKFAHFVLSGQYGGADGQLAPNAPVSFGGGGMSGTFGGSKPVPRSDDPPGLTLRVVYVGSGRAIVDLHAV
jgi:major membrane immunogen (membrane-anchored lipoprotein)